MKDSGFRKVYNDKDNYDHHIKKKFGLFFIFKHIQK